MIIDNPNALLDKHSGECRRNAPRRVLGDSNKDIEPVYSDDAVWPFTEALDWCGEFAEKINDELLSIDEFNTRVKGFLRMREREGKPVKEECLNHLVLSSVKQLEYAISEYGKYYHHERIHQSLGRIIEPIHKTSECDEIVCIERLGGLLKSYHRLAA